MIGIFGDIGSGKTLYTTWYVLRYYCEQGLYRSCFANYHIKSPNSKRPVHLLTQEEFHKLGSFQDALVVLDEAYLWMDSRMSGTKRNREVSYLILQSRKRGFDIIYNAQAASSVDLRLRRFTQIAILAERRNAGFKYTTTYNGRLKETFLSDENAGKVFPYFDTHEIIAYESLE